MAINIEGAIRGDDPRIPKVESLNGVTVLGFLNGKVVSIDATLMDLADMTINHFPYIGEDYYVYVWNKESQVYIKTEIYVKGEQGEKGPKGDKGDALKYSDLTEENKDDLRTPIIQELSKNWIKEW